MPAPAAIFPMIQSACSFISGVFCDSSTVLICRWNNGNLQINVDWIQCIAETLTMCINWTECPDIILSMSDDLLIKFLKSPSVFMMTLVSESFSSWNIRSVPNVLMIFVFMCSSVWNVMFISAQMPFSRSASSWFCVNLHSNSMAPSSTIGSLAGENSSSKLQMVDVTTVKSSFDGLPDESAIKGRQTRWSWNVVRNCCTERDNECKHRTAASRTSALGSPRPARTSSMIPSFSMIRFRISSSLAPSDAKQRKAPCRDVLDEHCSKLLNDFIRWLLIAASRCNSESIWNRTKMEVKISLRWRWNTTILLQPNKPMFRPL